MTIEEGLAYDIEQLWIEGMNEPEIAETLGIGIEVVEGWAIANSLYDRDWEVKDDEEYYNPYATVNS